MLCYNHAAAAAATVADDHTTLYLAVLVGPCMTATMAMIILRVITHLLRDSDRKVAFNTKVYAFCVREHECA